jgi:hypothetical protein
VAPLAAYALGDIMQAAWPAAREALEAAPSAKWFNALDAGMRIIATDLVRDTVRSIRADGPTVAAAATRDDPTQLSSYARTMANSFMTRGSTTMRGGAVDEGTAGAASYDRRRGAFFAALATALGHQIDDAIRLGWRDFSQIAANETGTIALSIGSLALLDAAACSCGSISGVQVTLESSGSRVTQTAAALPVPREAGYWHFDDQCYFDHWRPAADSGALSGSLTFVLQSADGKALPLSAAMPMPQKLDYGHRRYVARVRDRDDSDVGEVAYDLRLVGPATAAAETAARLAWNKTRGRDFAHAFGARAGALAAERFPLALKACCFS